MSPHPGTQTYLDTLQEVTLGLLAQRNLDQLLEDIVCRAASLTGAPNAGLYILDDMSDEMVMRFALGVEADDVGRRYRREGPGFYAKAWNSGQLEVLDDYAAWEGHMPEFEMMHAGMFVPLLEPGGRVVGLLGLSHNQKERTFTATDQDWTRRLAQVAAVALENARLHTAARRELAERRRAEQALYRRDLILAAVSGAARQFLAGDWQDRAAEVLADLGQAAGVERAYIFCVFFNPQGEAAAVPLHTWDAPDVAPLAGLVPLDVHTMRSAGFGRWEKELAEQRVIHGRLGDLPAGEATTLAAQGVQSILVAPIFSAGCWWGFMGLDACNDEREWSPAEIEAVQAFAGIVGAAVERQQMEEELHERQRFLAASEARLRSLVSALPDTAFIYDEDGRYLRCLTTRPELLYKDTQQLTGQLTADILPPGPGRIIQDGITRTVQSGLPQVIEYQLEVPVGLCWFEGRTALLPTPPGEKRQVIFLAINITERKQAENRLRELQEFLQRIFASLPQMVIISDAHTNQIEYSNRPDIFETLTIDQHNLAGDAERLNWVHPDDQAERQRFMSELHTLGENEVRTQEFRRRGPDGAYRWLRGYYAVFERDPAGGAARIIAVVEDITPRRTAEQEVRELHHLLDNIFKSLPFLVTIQNTDTNQVEYANRTHSLDGMLISELANLPYEQRLQYIHPDDQAALQDYLRGRSLLQDGEVKVIEYRARNIQGEIRWRRAHAAPFGRHPDGRVAKILVVQEDITAQKEIEASLVEAQKLAGIGTLAAGVAHEINTPLQVITGSSESILNQLKEGNPEPDALVRRMEMINRNAWRMAEIVRSLQAYARASRDTSSPASLNDLVRDALLLVEHQFKTWANIDVRTELGKNLPDFTCDRNKIIQVLINLLNNAHDAMPNGGAITIRTGFDPGAQHLTLDVSDTGQGIPEEIRSRIFDPFFTTKPVGKGTGLGLSIVLGIVSAHGGEITIESAPYAGTTFHVTLALTSPETPAPDAGYRYE